MHDRGYLVAIADLSVPNPHSLSYILLQLVVVEPSPGIVDHYVTIPWLWVRMGVATAYLSPLVPNVIIILYCC